MLHGGTSFFIYRVAFVFVSVAGASDERLM